MFPVTAKQIAQAIIMRVATVAGGGAVSEGCLIGPNTVMQYGKMKAQSLLLNLDQFFAPAAAHFPLHTRSSYWTGVPVWRASQTPRRCLLEACP